jgi:hypothetical protein
MKLHEAVTKKIYRINGNLVTTKELVAFHINTSWKYSNYWKNETWVEQAKEDCLNRINSKQKELNNLQLAMLLLRDIQK